MILKCLYCEEEFESPRKRKYCNREHMQKHWHIKNYVPEELKNNKCIYCGKDFKSRHGVKYCSISCNEKYKRRLKKKHCLNCNKEIDIGKSKFCDADCMNIYYTINPKYTKICVQCDKEYKTNNKSQILCDKECQNEWESNKRLEVSQKEFKEKFETNNPNFIYIDGYESYSSTVTIKCRQCGGVLERGAQTASPSKSEVDIQCSNCISIKNTKIALLDILVRRCNSIVREQNKVIMDVIRAEKQMEYEEQRRKDLTTVCKECGKIFNATIMGTKYCSVECRSRRNARDKEIRKRKRIIKNGKVEWDISLRKLIKRDKNICHICKEQCDIKDYVINKQGHFIVGKDYPSIDHVAPVSKGGTHTWDNVKIAHHQCNSIKSDKEVYEEGNGQLIIAI